MAFSHEHAPPVTRARVATLFCFGAVCTESLAQETADNLSDPGSLAPAIHTTRLDYSEFDTPEAVTVITQDDIRLAGYIEISELFRSIPGFRIVKIGDESRVSYHGTNGRQNRRLLVTIDGRNVLIGDGQYVEFDRLPIELEDIARVTVTRGPNGAAYGDNAFLASIDFQTVGRDDPRGFALRAGGGYNHRRKASVSGNKDIGALVVQFSAGAEHDGGYDFFDAAGTPRDDGKDLNRARLTIQREVSERSLWRLDANLYDGENKTGIRPLRLTGEQQNNGNFVALSNRRELGESSRLDWVLSHNHQSESIRSTGCYTPDAIAAGRLAIPDPELQARVLAPTLFVPGLLGVSLEDTCFFTDIAFGSDRTELHLEYEFLRGPWRYIVGGSAARTDASSAQRFAGQDQRQRSYRVFGETDLVIGDIHASLGFMAQDSSNVEDIEPAWRTAISWQFAPNQALRYSHAHSFRVPSLIESETFWTGAFNFGRRDDPLTAYAFSIPLPLITNSTRLRPETIESDAVGYFGVLLRSSATLDVKLFREKIRNSIESGLFYFSPPPFNGQPFMLKGVEGEFALRLSEQWKISGNYSYLETDAGRDTLEWNLYGRHAGSLALTFHPSTVHGFSIGYYGNSAISGNSYDRFDLVYNYSRSIGQQRAFRSQLVLNHHVGGRDGFRETQPLLSNEGYFAHLNQLFLFTELTF